MNSQHLYTIFLQLLRNLAHRLVLQYISKNETLLLNFFIHLI